MIKFEVTRSNVIIAASIATILVTSSQASAQSADPEELISRADTNGDGNISWSEVTALRLDGFNRADRNNDGVVNSDDSPPRFLAARFNEAFEQLQANFDGDRDGEITQEEMLNAPAPMFEKGDVDEDGVLRADEIAALRATRADL